MVRALLNQGDEVHALVRQKSSNIPRRRCQEKVPQEKVPGTNLEENEEKENEENEENVPSTNLGTG